MMKHLHRAMYCLLLSSIAGTIPLVGMDGGRHQLQQPQTSQAMYLELLGNGIFLSLNYEHRFWPDFGVRVGGLPTFGTDLYWIFLQGIYVYSPGGMHHLECGAGIGLFALKWCGWWQSCPPGPPEPVPYFPVHIGYRLTPPDGGILIRLSFTPLISLSGIAPWGGASIGWAW
ncbi:MAG: hypothetical protein NZ481_04550 [Candidatus Kapabacteria bacterium]|nr:hypothetical protein [Candidatus Kapabacteria bacterium]